MPEKRRKIMVDSKKVSRGGIRVVADSIFESGANLRSSPTGAKEYSDEEGSVIAQAVKVIGDKSAAMRWMGTPVRALDYATPISLLGTRDGRRAVITVLGRLEHGVL